ncbi:hypothetical protein C8R45DRAFT_1115016 [Mycena sanguinolenta]|nr:hypothetical protein C8R45DRAFT_1115016 [Mycena sanguinolenta]
MNTLADDLMQTSCGSPCYTVPELVVSEGLYVGSAVDIWNYGVILYRMLAGYVVNTPLSSLEYIYSTKPPIAISGSTRSAPPAAQVHAPPTTPCGSTSSRSL